MNPTYVFLGGMLLAGLILAIIFFRLLKKSSVFRWCIYFASLFGIYHLIPLVSKLWASYRPNDLEMAEFDIAVFFLDEVIFPNAQEAVAGLLAISIAVFLLYLLASYLTKRAIKNGTYRGPMPGENPNDRNGGLR